jgi:tellurium resistance protein TerD
MITLEKKKPLNLSKSAPGLSKIRVGLSWDESNIGGASPDCDASVFMLGSNGKIPDESYFVFFNNLQSGDGSVQHTGDNRTGAGDGDDESINIDLARVSSNVDQLLFAITIHNMSDGFHFGNVTNASVRVYNAGTGSTICEYRLSENYPYFDAMIIGRCYRNGAEWEFEGMGQAYAGGLQAAVDLYA